jgi:outer membrane protein
MNTPVPVYSARALVYLVLFSVFSLLFNYSAHAIEPARIGFVDMPRIMKATGIAEKAEAKARQGIAAAESKLEAEQQAIVKLQQDYKRDEAIMSESQRKSKQQALQSRMQAYQKMAVDQQNKLKKSQMELAREELKPVQKAIGKIAEEEGLNAVFDRSESGLIFIDRNMDLTDRVIKRLGAGGN